MDLQKYHPSMMPQEAEITRPPETLDEERPDLDVMIGQMLMVGFRGCTVGAESPVIQDIVERHIGGVVLYDKDASTGTFGRNITSSQQLKQLTTGLQSAAGIPLFVAIDQEGGRVARLKESTGFPATISAAELGANDDERMTYLQAESIALTLSDHGINMNFAPVVDVNVNPQSPAIGGLGRSFSEDPRAVVRHATQFIEAHRRHGILTALKHFPGHGSATNDSHLGLTDVSETWSDLELDPYAALIPAGLVDMVMTAHVFNAHLDPDRPATLSRAIITSLLRDQLGFEGVVVSDDMQMGAIANQYGLELALRNALDAGVDVIMFANNLQYEEGIASRAIDLIKGMVRKGEVSEERIAASYRRIRALKLRQQEASASEGDAAKAAPKKPRLYSLNAR